MHIAVKLDQAVDSGDVRTIQEIFSKHPKLKASGAMMGGDWFHYAARKSTIEVLEFLIEDGFDIHAVAKFKGDNALANAAGGGRADNVEFLLGLGVKIDMEGSTHRNPLFRAVNAASGRLGAGLTEVKGDPEKVIELLIAAGADPWQEYGPPEDRCNVGGYALFYGVPHITELLARLAANGDSDKYNLYMQKARDYVDEQDRAASAN